MGSISSRWRRLACMACRRSCCAAITSRRFSRSRDSAGAAAATCMAAAGADADGAAAASPAVKKHAPALADNMRMILILNVSSRTFCKQSWACDSSAECREVHWLKVRLILSSGKYGHTSKGSGVLVVAQTLAAHLEDIPLSAACECGGRHERPAQPRRRCWTLPLRLACRIT